MGPDLSNSAMDEWHELSDGADGCHRSRRQHGCSSDGNRLPHTFERVRRQLHHRSHHDRIARSVAASPRSELGNLPEWFWRKGSRHKLEWWDFQRYQPRSGLRAEWPPEFKPDIHLQRQCHENHWQPQPAIRWILRGGGEERNPATRLRYKRELVF